MILRQSENKSVVILMDKANTDKSAKSFNRKLDLKAIRDYLANIDEGRELKEMIVYLGIAPRKERFQEQRNRDESYTNYLRREGFMVVTKEGKPKGNKYEADVDVVMAIDGMEFCLEVKPDIVVLVTGDSDFALLAQKLRRRGIRVEVASVEQSLGKDLKNAANSIIDLTPVFNEFEANNPDADYHALGNEDFFDS